jgi:SAM-dependent methyltransferase
VAGDPLGAGWIGTGAMTEVWQIYDICAREYDRHRAGALMERGYLDDVVARLAPAACVLDLGCGCGEPIARFFIERGFDVTGVDAAPGMLAICRERFANAAWIEADMRGLDLARRFDAIIAWDSFFHLTQDEQRAMFPTFSRHIAPGGGLLFTSGPKAGEAIGNLYGHPLFHASLDPEEYREMLAREDFTVLRYRAEDPDCGGHTVWLTVHR